ncbi:hypothetical protein IAT40_004054 [Kwoniella sp. CBS 6097]
MPSYQPDAADVQPSAASRLPGEILSFILILDTFANFDLSALKTATRIDISCYQRYYARLYRNIKFHEHNVNVLHDLVYRPYTGHYFDDDYERDDNCSEASSSSPDSTFDAYVSSARPVDLHTRARSRIRGICRSVVHLSLEDEQAGKILAMKVKSFDHWTHGRLFPNFEFVSLRNGFMRYLESFDYKGRSLSMNSKLIVQQLGTAMRPKHLCIEKLRVREHKDSKSPEIWKIGLLKQDWKLESTTSHNDMWDTRTLFGGSPLHRFYIEDPEEESYAKVIDEHGWAEGFTIELVCRGWHYMDYWSFSEALTDKLEVKTLDVARGKNYPCICCGRTR